MKKIFWTVVLVVFALGVVLSMTACAPEVPDTESNQPPVDNSKTAVEWGLDVNSTARRMFAAPDPDNPLDQKRYDKEALLSDPRLLDSRKLPRVVVTLSNSETINNLFYDYQPEDFGIYNVGVMDLPDRNHEKDFSGAVNLFKVGEKLLSISDLREELRNGEKIDLSTFFRAIEINYNDTLNENDPIVIEEFMRMLDILMNLNIVVDIDFTGEGWSTD